MTQTRNMQRREKFEMRKMIAALGGATLALLAVQPASAQDQGGDKVNVVVVYGDDACPESSANEIVVCPRLDESERYRIPPLVRDNPQDTANESWTNRVQAYEYVGKSGTLSCSPVGGGGFTGCTQELIDKAYAERESGSALQAGRMIEQVRQDRLSQIDAEAEATESRVAEIEREQAEMRAAREAEEDAAISGQDTP